MKKVLLGLGLVISGSLMAQKPASADSKFSLEGLINYNANDGMNWTAPSLRMRYFVNDNIAARLQFGFGGDGSSVASMPSKETHTYVDASNASNTGTVEIDRGQWDMKIGGEYHLKGTDRMSPYFAGTIGFGKGSEKQTWTNVFYSDPNDPSSPLAYANGFSANASGGFSTFSWGLGAGFDYYVVENLYVGMEFNLTSTKVSEDNTESTVTTPLGEIKSSTPCSTYSYTNIGAAHGSIRIGWRF